MRCLHGHKNVSPQSRGISIPTIRPAFEAQRGDLGGQPDTRARIVAALEFGGVEFTNGEQPGVRLRKVQ